MCQRKNPAKQRTRTVAERVPRRADPSHCRLPLPLPQPRLAPAPRARPCGRLARRALSTAYRSDLSAEIIAGCVRIPLPRRAPADRLYRGGDLGRPSDSIKARAQHLARQVQRSSLGRSGIVLKLLFKGLPLLIKFDPLGRDGGTECGLHLVQAGRHLGQPPHYRRTFFRRQLAHRVIPAGPVFAQGDSIAGAQSDRRKWNVLANATPGRFHAKPRMTTPERAS